MNFLRRQIKAVVHSRKYVITYQDAVNMRDHQSDETRPYPIEKLTEEFEPDGDTASN